MDVQATTPALPPSDVEARALERGNERWQVEQYGIGLIPDAERKMRPRELFSVWFGANLILTYIIIGSVVWTLGLTFWQALAALAIGNALYVFVGIGGIAGPRAGTATMVISRAVYGIRGNRVASFLGWLTEVGWQAVNLVIGCLATFALLEKLGVDVTGVVKAIVLAVLVAVTYGVAILGHATITYLQKGFTIALGVLLVGAAVQIVPDADPGAAPMHLGASTVFGAFAVAVTIVAAAPVSWANYPADYSRYVPESASPRAVAAWSAFGGFVPALLIGALGLSAATATDMTDPIGGLEPLLADWYYVPFLVAVLGGTITNNFLNTYSSGLTLQALGVKWSRAKSIRIDGTIATVAAVYAVFFYDFTSAFSEFLSLMVVWLAPWVGVFFADLAFRRGRYLPSELLRERGGAYWGRGGFHRNALVAWVIGIVAALLVTNSTRFQSPLSVHVLGGADLSVPVGIVVAAAVYALVTRGRVLGDPGRAG